MHLIKFELCGFGSYRDYSYVDFPLGVISIHGVVANRSMSSNGAGKSTLVMAILFALYGEGKFDTLEDIWNTSLEKNKHVYVKLTFSIANDIYIVERGRNKSASYLDVYINDVRVGSSIKEAQDILTKSLGLDHKLFTSSLFVQQGDVFAFINSTPSERREYLDKILGLNIWRDAYKYVSDDRKKFNVEHEMVVSKLVQHTTTLEALTNEISQLENLVASKTRIEQELQAIEHQLEDRNKLVTLQKELQSITKELDTHKQLELQIKTTLTTLQSQKERTQKELSEIELVYSQYKPDFKFQSEILIDDYEKTIASSRSELTTIEQKLNDTNKKIWQLQESIKSYDANIKAGICSYCKQTITTDYINELRANYDAKKIELANEITSLMTTTKTLELNRTEQQNQLQEYTLKLQNTKRDLEKFVEVESRFKTLSTNATQVLAELTQKITYEQNHLHEITEKIALLENQKTELENQLQVLHTDNYDISQLTTQKIQLQNQLKDIFVTEGRLKSKREIYTTLTNELEELKNKKELLAEELSLLEIVENVYKDIPTFLFQESIRRLEYYTNEILYNIFPNFSVKIYEDLDKKSRKIMIIFNIDGKSRKFNMLSGGEVTICALSLRLGLSRIIQYSNQSPVNIIVLDEIFGALDQENRTLVVESILSLANYFSQIFVITHTEEQFLFPNNIIVSKDNDGISMILHEGETTHVN